MSPLDLVRIAWQGVRRRPLRSSLTAVSLLIGVMTVVLVQGSSALVQSATVRQAILANGPGTTMRVVLNETPGPAAAQEDWWLAHLKAVTADVEGRTAVTDSYPGITVVAENQDAVSLEMSVVSPSLREIRPFRVVSGSWFPAKPTSSLAPEVVLNRTAGSLVDPSAGRVWLSTREGLGRIHVQITGIVDDGTGAPTAYLATGSAATLRRGGLVPAQRSLLVSSPSVSQTELRARVMGLGARSGRAAELGEVTRVDAVDQYADQLSTTRDIFLLIAVLSLLVGALGILNIGLATLKERAEELALRRALGATRRQILYVVLLESQLVALSAACCAVLMANLCVPLMLRRLSTTPVEFTGLPLTAVAIGVAASSLAALAGAAAPSIRAVRVPIATLLR